MKNGFYEFEKRLIEKRNYPFTSHQASVLGVPYVKFLAFGTPNPKIWASWGVLYAKKFGTPLQYHLKYETVWTTMVKLNIIILLHFSLSLCLLSLSLSISSLSSLLKKVAQDHSPILIAISLPILLPHFPVLAVDLTSPHCWFHRLILRPPLPTSTALTTDLQISLNWIVSVRFGMGFDVGFVSVFWIVVVWVMGRGFGLVGLGF